VRRADSARYFTLMRLHIVLALVTALALYLTFRSGERPRFSFANVQAMAQHRASEKFQPPADMLPPQLKKLTPDQELGIFWNDIYRLWRKDGLPFQVDFYPLSNVVHTPVTINTVDRHGANRLAYSPSFFRYNFPINPPLPHDLGYGGFYVRYPNMAPKSDSRSPLDGFFSVEGASYFRVLAKDQVYGLSARALAINAIVENKEEFPYFTDWWLYRPAPNATAMTLDALMESPSVSGAYEFTLRPGAQTSVDVHATLFFRKDVPQLGLAPFSSMYFYGENAKNHFGNYHPEIHDSDGVLTNTGKGEWAWRPLEQETFRQVYNFIDENPRGFGLIQRDRNFQHYQDLGMNYNLRPSAWVTPHGQWGKGAVQLIQLVTNNPNTDNVVLQWHPDLAPKAGDRLDLSYTIDYYMNDANRPPLAYATQTLVNDPAPPPPPAPTLMGPPAPAAPAPKPAKNAPLGPTPVQFLVDFAGNGIEDIAADHRPDIDLACDATTARVRESSVQKNDYDKSWRATFTIIPAKVNMPVELHCTLRDKGQPLTETWTYTWHPAAPGK
jgi:periplasmic glucans biosynthesis protein